MSGVTSSKMASRISILGLWVIASAEERGESEVAEVARSGGKGDNSIGR